MNPRMDQLVESHIEELRHQAAQQRPILRMARRRREDGSGARFKRVKSRLGSYLVDLGERLQTTRTRSHLALGMSPDTGVLGQPPVSSIGQTEAGA
jgi:hypothetical protein